MNVTLRNLVSGGFLAAVVSFTFMAPKALADVLEVRINGTVVTCPTAKPQTGPSGVLPIGPPALTNTFDCIVSLPSEGTFRVSGSYRAMDFAVPAGRFPAIFDDSLGLSGSVQALSSVNPTFGTPVTVILSQYYQLPASVSTVTSFMEVTGMCNNKTDELDAVVFFVNGAPNPVPPPPAPPRFLCSAAPWSVTQTGGGPALAPLLLFLSQTGTAYFPPNTAAGNSVSFFLRQTAVNGN